MVVSWDPSSHNHGKAWRENGNEYQQEAKMEARHHNPPHDEYHLLETQIEAKDDLREDERNWNFFPEVQMKDLKDAGEPAKDW